MFDIMRRAPMLGQVKVMGDFWSWLGLEAPAEEIASPCYTCASGSDVQYGVPAVQAADLQNQGYDCHRDQCADQAAPDAFTLFGRIPLAPGLGRRALR
jgi:hypothetical protein